MPIDGLVSVVRGRVPLEAVSNAVKFVGNLIRETAHGDNGSKGNQGSNQCIFNEVLTGFLIQKGPQQSLHLHRFLLRVPHDSFVHAPIVERGTTVGSLNRGWDAEAMTRARNYGRVLDRKLRVAARMERRTCARSCTTDDTITAGEGAGYLSANHALHLGGAQDDNGSAVARDQLVTFKLVQQAGDGFA